MDLWPWPSAPTERSSSPAAGTDGAALGRGHRNAPRSTHPASTPMYITVAFSPDGNSFLTGDDDHGGAALPKSPRTARRPGSSRHLGGGPHRVDARRGPGHDPGARQRGLAEAPRATGATGWSAGNRGRTEARSDPVRYRPDRPRSCLDASGGGGTRPTTSSRKSSNWTPKSAVGIPRSRPDPERQGRPRRGRACLPRGGSSGRRTPRGRHRCLGRDAPVRRQHERKPLPRIRRSRCSTPRARRRTTTSAWP